MNGGGIEDGEIWATLKHRLARLVWASQDGAGSHAGEDTQPQSIQMADSAQPISHVLEWVSPRPQRARGQRRGKSLDRMDDGSAGIGQGEEA